MMIVDLIGLESHYTHCICSTVIVQVPQSSRKLHGYGPVQTMEVKKRLEPSWCKVCHKDTAGMHKRLKVAPIPHGSVSRGGNSPVRRSFGEEK